MTGRETTIHTDDETDRWQWVCPRGHRSREPTNNHFWCAKRARRWAQDAEMDPEFGELRNERTGEAKRRDEIRLVAPGPYQHRKESA